MELLAPRGAQWRMPAGYMDVLNRSFELPEALVSIVAEQERGTLECGQHARKGALCVSPPGVPRAT